jgi:peptide chain release factor subunit 3
MMISQVVSARNGEWEASFERHGFLRECFDTVPGYSERHLVIAVNKMDQTPSGSWDEERWKDITQRYTAYLTQVRGYRREQLKFVPVSALQGNNLTTPIEKKICSWYDGPTLVEALDKTPAKGLGNRFQPMIFDMTMAETKGDSIEATGRLLSGSISPGQRISILHQKVG